MPGYVVRPDLSPEEKREKRRIEKDMGDLSFKQALGSPQFDQDNI